MRQILRFDEGSDSTTSHLLKAVGYTTKGIGSYSCICMRLAYCSPQLPRRHEMADVQLLTQTPIGLLAQDEPEAGDLSDLKPLSCTHCRQRKIKCDKSNPCSGCKRSGSDCVSPKRMRVPRGRQGVRNSKSRDDELLRRIGKLEALVGKMGGHITTPVTSGESNGRQTTSLADFTPLSQATR